MHSQQKLPSYMNSITYHHSSILIIIIYHYLALFSQLSVNSVYCSSATA